MGITKLCKHCEQVKPLEDFVKSSRAKDGRTARCKTCTAAYFKERGYTVLNRENRREYGRKCRLQVLEHYGTKCACCGETRPEFLALDHINGGGNAHRRLIGHGKSRGGSEFYRWLIKNDYPEGFQLLCHNCNQSRSYYGYCPHTRE